MSEAPLALAADIVYAFVAKAHGDLEFVQQALADEPRLLNAAWDWGGGDWETGLGASLGPHKVTSLAESTPIRSTPSTRSCHR